MKGGWGQKKPQEERRDKGSEWERENDKQGRPSQKIFIAFSPCLHGKKRSRKTELFFWRFDFRSTVSLVHQQLLPGTQKRQFYPLWSSSQGLILFWFQANAQRCYYYSHKLDCVNSINVLWFWWQNLKNSLFQFLFRHHWIKCLFFGWTLWRRSPWIVTFKSNIVLLLGSELTGHIVITESKFVLCFCVCVFFLVFSLSSITAVFSKDWPAWLNTVPGDQVLMGPCCTASVWSNC